MTAKLGPVNLFDALALFLPRSLPNENGVTIALPAWGIRAAMPMGVQPLPYPHGVFEVLATKPIYRRRNPVGMVEREDQQTDVFVYSTGTLSYHLSQPDWSATVGVTGFVGGVAHAFAAPADYGIGGDGTALVFTGSGALPDNGTSVTIAYTHRMFSRVFGNQSRPVVRCTLKAKDVTVGGRGYPKEGLAHVLGESLEQFLAMKEGTVLEQPSGTPLNQAIMVGPVIESRVGYSDASLGLATWVVEFRLHRHSGFQTAYAQRIRRAPVVPSILSG